MIRKSKKRLEKRQKKFKKVLLKMNTRHKLSNNVWDNTAGKKRIQY